MVRNSGPHPFPVSRFLLPGVPIAHSRSSPRLADEQAETTAAFLHRATAWYAALRIRLRAVLSDNGRNYRSHLVAAACRTLQHECAYAQAYGRSVFRTRALVPYLRFYNTEGRHTALGFRTPLQRLATKSVNNVFLINS